jgi:hypothetical protein
VTAGIEKIDERPCYRADAMKPADRTITLWFDQESHLLRRVASKVKAVNVNTLVVIDESIEDYRDVEGIRIAHRVRRVIDARESTSVLDSVRLNTAIDEDLFEVDETTR